MNSAAQQADGERAIFCAFARVSRLGIIPESIDSRQPPEPDIRCHVEGEGAVAFELVEVVREDLARAINERDLARKRFRKAYAKLSCKDRAQIKACLGGAPAVSVTFPEATPPKCWRRAADVVLRTLVERASADDAANRLREGEFPASRIPNLHGLVTEVRVQRSSHGEPDFFVLEATEVVDVTRQRLCDKFTKDYRTDAPIELVAYYVSSPPRDDADWRDGVAAFLRERQPTSPFRRVWLYDGFAKRILLSFPPLMSPSA